MKLLINFLPFLLVASTLNFNVNFENYSNFMPISELLNKWKTYYSNKKSYLILNNRINLSYKNIGIFKSIYLYGKSNNDTTYLIYILNSKNDLQKGRYKIDLKLKGYEKEGIFYNFNKNNFYLRVNFFKVKNHQKGYLIGNVIAYDNKHYDFNGFANYYFSKNYLYHLWSYKKSNGYGYSFDVKYKFIFRDNYIFFNIYDIGKLYIKNSPHSIVYINSSNKTIKNGYIYYKPVVSGKETYENIVLNTTPKYNAEIGNSKIDLGLKKINIYIPYVDVKYKKFKFGYEFKFKSYRFYYNNKSFLFCLFTNKFNLNKASTLGIIFNYVKKF